MTLPLFTRVTAWYQIRTTNENHRLIQSPAKL
jgi:hypothetical protein